jgi:hypothetical protein
VFSVAAVLGHVQRGRLRALANTAPRRSQLLPDIPTIHEAGYPTLEAVVWLGILVPATTPPDIVAFLNSPFAAPRKRRDQGRSCEPGARRRRVFPKRIHRARESRHPTLGRPREGLRLRAHGIGATARLPEPDKTVSAMR